MILIKMYMSRFKREVACVDSGCIGVYSTSLGVAGQGYYGRGYLQLVCNSLLSFLILHSIYIFCITSTASITVLGLQLRSGQSGLVRRQSTAHQS